MGCYRETVSLISIIIPALDEERALPATLDAVLAQSVFLQLQFRVGAIVSGDRFFRENR